LRFSDTNDLDQAIAIAFADTRILKLYLFSTTAWIIDPPVKRAGHCGLPTFEKGSSMLNLIYHLVLACHALGHGRPSKLLRLTWRGRIRAFDRPNTLASTDKRDLFGSRRQVAIEHMNIQIHPPALAKASSL
jgi:hypothetical protein